MRKRYAREAAQPVENDVAALSRMGLKVVSADLAQLTGVVRHDPAPTAAVVFKLALEGRRRKAAAG